jgi:thiol-disulfide isomerase/thioredoxin
MSPLRSLVLCALALALTVPLSAQTDARQQAIDALRELTLTKRPMNEWPERDAAIAAWAERIEKDAVDLGDHRFLVGVARYFAKDVEGAGAIILDELTRLEGKLPTRDFDSIAGRVLLNRGVLAVRAEDYVAARPNLVWASKLYEAEPSMVVRVAGRMLAESEDPAAVALLDELLAALYADPRVQPAQRTAAVKAIFAPPPARDKPAAAELAPFEAKDLDGNDVSLAALRGKVVLVDFWATWCGPCLREMPHVVKAHERFRDRGFVVVGISLDSEPGQVRGGAVVPPDPKGETTTKLRKTMAEHGMTWPVVYEGGGWDTRLAKENGIRSIPATFLIDREGKVRYTDLRGDDLARRVEELLAPPKGR